MCSKIIIITRQEQCNLKYAFKLKLGGTLQNMIQHISKVHEIETKGYFA